MKEQAKKMNVESLRQKSDSSENMEVKIAKVTKWDCSLILETFQFFSVFFTNNYRLPLFNNFLIIFRERQ